MPKLPPLDLNTIDPMIRAMRVEAINRQIARSETKSRTREAARRRKQNDHAHRVAESERLENAAMVARSCKRLRDPAQREADAREHMRQRAA